MKRNSQMIVLLDVMFIFLFALILKPEKDTLHVKIDEYINIPNTLIFAKSSDNSTLIYENKRWRELKASDISRLKDFAVHPEPRKIYKNLTPLPKDKKLKIKTYVYGELYKSITKMVFTKCRVNQECQSNILIYIKQDGSIEIK